MNRLSNERSPYLKKAASQKVEWHPWSEEAFEKAGREEKPVFLSTGAVWCHWCHVMARECFESDEIAEVMNRNFVNIKLDRDERPDIDRVYQQAVASMGGGSGWPLSVFLTADKKPFFGGTYFPPSDAQGRPGFRKILAAVLDFYRTRPGEVMSFAEKVADAIKPDDFTPEGISEALLDEAENKILSILDTRNGGFGDAPKFPMSATLEFLMRLAARGHRAAADGARLTLFAMARGGIQDHLGGGFHRYSVDDAWLVPHFEKMADDNAGLLQNYIQGYALFGNERMKTVARDILRFTREQLSDPSGGFFASQDADTGADEGGYFTWTAREMRQVLNAEEYEVISLHLFHPHGSLPHDPQRNVLAVRMEPSTIAEQTGKSREAVQNLIETAKLKLLKARQKRARPFVDTTLYTSLNGMMISACLRGFMAFRDPALRELGLKGLERVFQDCFDGNGLSHAPGVPALLDDYVHLLDALITAYEASATQLYLSRAEDLMKECRRVLFDATEGGYFDTGTEVLGIRSKRIQDVPHPAANSLAITLQLKLASIKGNSDYRREAEQELMLFAGTARSLGVHAGSYFCSLDSFYHMLTFRVEAEPESELAQAARIRAVASRSAIVYGEEKGRIIPCTPNACYEPLFDEAGLDDFLRNRVCSS